MGSVGNVNRSRDMVEWMCYQPLSILRSGLCILHQNPRLLNTASNAAQSSPTAIHNGNTAMAATGVEAGSLLNGHAAIAESNTKLLFPVLAGLHRQTVRHGARTAESCATKSSNRNRHHVLTAAHRLSVTGAGGRPPGVAVASGRRITLARMAFVPGATAHASAIQKYVRHVEAYEERTSGWNQSGVRYAAKRSSRRHAKISIAARPNAPLKGEGAPMISVLVIRTDMCVCIVARRTRPRLRTAIRSAVENMPMRGVRRTRYLGRCQQQRQSDDGARCAAIQLHQATQRRADRKSASGLGTWRLRQPDRKGTGGREHAKSAASCLCRSMETSDAIFIQTNASTSTGSELVRRQGAHGKRPAPSKALIHSLSSGETDGAVSCVGAAHRSDCEARLTTERRSLTTLFRWHMAERTAMQIRSAFVASAIKRREPALPVSYHWCDGEGGRAGLGGSAPEPSAPTFSLAG